jgi:hypothetical protein
MSNRDPDEEVDVPLTPDETAMLVQGLHTWGGPGHPTDSIARAIGYRNVGQLLSDGIDLAERLGGSILTRRDWTRAIMALEISFGSDAGAGWEWSMVTSYTDEYSIGVIRGLQYKLVGVRLQSTAAEPIL